MSRTGTSDAFASMEAPEITGSIRPAARVPTEEAPGAEPPRLIIHNDLAKTELDWSPRPAETTITQTAESLRDLGLLDGQ